MMKCATTFFNEFLMHQENKKLIIKHENIDSTPSHKYFGLFGTIIKYLLFLFRTFNLAFLIYEKRPGMKWKVSLIRLR